MNDSALLLLCFFLFFVDQFSPSEYVRLSTSKRYMGLFGFRGQACCCCCVCMFGNFTFDPVTGSYSGLWKHLNRIAAK